MSLPHQNCVGPQIRALRRGRSLTQAMLAARCGVLGWDIGENTITKIETQIRCVVDWELLCLAAALDTSVSAFFPAGHKVKHAVQQHFERVESNLNL